MSITDELREYAVEHECDSYRKLLNAIADRIDAEHEKAIRELNNLADASVLLPVDADGVPIHVGDRMEVCSTRSIVVIGVGNVTEDDGTYGVFCQRDDGYYEWFNARFLRHVKPDSWENIIADAVKNGMYDHDNERIQQKLVERCRRLAGDAE